jgi:S-DNA-T family DNA segregation ATPase FtsK/SpoIIIE
MPEEARRRLDLVALGLLAAHIFLAAALLTYDAADPPSTLTFPPRAHTANACGPLGAFVARGLFSGFGLGAYYLALSSGAVTVLLLLRRTIHGPAIRFLGWLLTLVALCTLASFSLSQLAPGPVIGAGGYLGAVGRGLLETHFARAGSYILIFSVLLGGVTLCLEGLIARSGRLAWRVVHGGLGALRSRAAEAEPEVKRRSKITLDPAAAPAAAPATGGKARRNDVQPGRPAPAAVERPSAKRASKPSEEAAPVTVPITARSMLTESADAGAGGPGHAGNPSHVEEPQPKPTFAQRLASAFRIKTRRDKLSDEMRADLDSGSHAGPISDYELPPRDLLQEAQPISLEKQEKEIRHRAQLLEKTFADFGFNVKVVEIETGPVVAQYEVELEAGLRLSKITSLADDLAVALRVPSVRVVAPIPGKNTVGVEVPNTERQIVRLREVMEEADAKTRRMQIPVYLGKDVAGSPMIIDLTSLPHLLIAGRTGTGKSVCLNTLIMSMLMTRRPDEVKMLMIDPKMVELTPYSRLPHLMHPVITDMKKAEAVLAWAVDKMEERYALLMRAGVRHMSVYNQLGEEELRDRLKPESDEDWQQIPTHLPYIVIVADEMADLMMTAPKEVESHIIRLAQKSRAVGIHLVLATQKPTVDVITGLIKSNLPARISFQVASRVDSRVVLDEMGADKLLGNGDMLFLAPATSTLIRGQGAYVGDDEIHRVVDFLSSNEPQFVTELVQLKPKQTEGAGKGTGGGNQKDDLFDAAVDIVVREGRGSVSLLQRALGIGYGRAARLIDYMCEDGIVGPYNGAQAREVLITPADWAARLGQAEEEPEPTRRRRLIIKPSENAMPPAKRGKRRNDEEELSALDEDESSDDNEEDFEDEAGDEQNADEAFAQLVEDEDE